MRRLVGTTPLVGVKVEQVFSTFSAEPAAENKGKNIHLSVTQALGCTESERLVGRFIQDLCQEIHERSEAQREAAIDEFPTSDDPSIIQGGWCLTKNFPTKQVRLGKKYPAAETALKRIFQEGKVRKHKASAESAFAQIMSMPEFHRNYVFRVEFTVEKIKTLFSKWAGGGGSED